MSTSSKGPFAPFGDAEEGFDKLSPNGSGTWRLGKRGFSAFKQRWLGVAQVSAHLWW